MDESEIPGAAVPSLRVVRGDPSPEELAALVAVLGAVSAGAAAARATAMAKASSGRPAWGDPARALRRPLSPGLDGWRGSAR